MREYGQVQCHFWQSQEVLSFSTEAKVLALYLLTGPHTNGLGCYRLPDGYVMADLGWPASTVSKAFEELFSTGFAKRFETVVLIPKFLRWNGIANPNVASARQKEFDALPAGEAKSRLARAMLEFGNHWANSFVKVLQTVAEGLPEQDHTLPNPGQRGSNPPGGTDPAPADDFDDRFAEFRLLYPKRNGDQRWETAKKHIRALLRKGHTWEEILDGTRRYAAWVRASGKEKTETVKQAATFVGRDRCFLEGWDPPRTKADMRFESNIDEVQKAKQRLSGGQQ
jgi:hypothetical protein